MDLAAARRSLSHASRVTVLTGAGISTDSGIPDFRGPNGLWTNNPAAEKASTLQNYLGDPSVREFAWQNRLANSAHTREPNDGHRALAALELPDRLVALVTQNVDGLHQRAGSDPARVVEVHGTMHFTICWMCRDRRPMQESLARVEAGESDPDCLVCRACGDRGILKSDTISFGQNLVESVIARALGAADQCDVLLAIGSSLQVFPVANMVPRAQRAGATIIIVNGEPTKMDHHADHLLRGEISEILPVLLASNPPSESSSETPAT
ncbi:MAG: Sir2 family NAD-dependent protein deacetylase [Ilumatobacteraceae bacterium]